VYLIKRIIVVFISLEKGEPVTIFVVLCGLILILYLKRIARDERGSERRFSLLIDFEFILEVKETLEVNDR
jgi:hypothetical protein